MTETGRVYLVGAGPGDPGLLTLRGRECLRRADVLVYDRLANERLLAEAKPRAERLYVGKKPDRHTLSQAEINRLLVALAREGKCVCRLKGGDPFVFGRGGEEALALAAAGVAFEVVPGVTSAIAAAAYAGIPVTHRGMATSFAVVTGHEDPTKESSSLRWDRLAAGADTLVVLMGVGNLAQIVQKLTAHGRPADTPVALVRWGTTPRQTVVSGTLADIADRAATAGVTPPAAVIVGEVVRLRPQLTWFENRPLFGRRIVVTRAREQASLLSEKLTALGAEVLEAPTIRIEELDDTRALDEALTRLGSYDWVVFTSANTVRIIRKRLEALGLDARVFAGAKLCALGPATGAALRESGLRADLVPEQYVAEAVVEALRAEPLDGTRILLPRAETAREVLPAELRKQGARVDVVAAYRTVTDPCSAECLREWLASGQVDVITFTASSTVRNFVDLVGRDGIRKLPPALVVASIGPVTTRTAREYGLPVHVTAGEHTLTGLVDSLCRFLNDDSPPPRAIEST